MTCTSTHDNQDMYTLIMRKSNRIKSETKKRKKETQEKGHISLCIRRIKEISLHVKPQILLLLKEIVQNKLPHKVWVECVVNHLCPPKLGERKRKRGVCRHVGIWLKAHM